MRSEGNNVTNRIVVSNGVRNVRNERPLLPHDLVAQKQRVFQIVAGKGHASDGTICQPYTLFRR